MKKQPTYLDGCFHLFRIKGDGKLYENEYLYDEAMDIFYNEESVGDRLKNELHQSNHEITTKITIPQYKGIDSKCVLKIGDDMHHVYNAYHFTNKDGFKETTLTLEVYEP